MPYRIDLSGPPEDAASRLIDLGALDVESSGRDLAALLPDDVDVARVAAALGLTSIHATPARGRDGGSVWVLRQRPVRIGSIEIVPADAQMAPDRLRLIDSDAFGTGQHATTSLCLELIEEDVHVWRPESMLDVGTGSGILALAALRAGVARVEAIDIDAESVRTSRENARLNGLESRLRVELGAVDRMTGAWPLVAANILAAPLIDMAPAIARRVTRGGRVILSGIRTTLAPEVERAYRHAGLVPVQTRTREGWCALTFRTSW